MTFGRLPGGWGGTCGLFAIALVAACSPHRTDQEAPDASAPDASTSALSAAPRDESAGEIAEQVFRAFATQPVLAERFAANADGFQTSRDGWVSAGWRSAWTGRTHHVGARLPSSAERSFEAGVGVSELYRLSFEHVGARPSVLRVDAGRGVYREVYPSTDVTFVASPERLEWAYTLRDDKAKPEIRLALRLPKNLPEVSADAQGGLEFLDAERHALLRMPRPMAVDAAGVAREASLRWDGKFVSVSIATEGLKYPIVLDPAVETAVWEPRVQIPEGRGDHAMSYDAKRDRVVVFGGNAGGSSAARGDTWEWDGLVWSLRSTSGPNARFEHMMTWDSAREVSLLFGGFGANASIWLWDGVAWVERCNTTPCSTTRPTSRRQAGFVFDTARNKAVLFGGYDFATRNDTWEWDGAAWTQVSSSGPMTARWGLSMAYDPATSRTLMFGGQASIGGALNNELWSYAGGAWSLVTTSGGPPAARNSGMFVNEGATGKVLLYAGTNPSYLSDAWELTTATNTWASLGAGAPGARRTLGVWDSARSRIVTFGGAGSGMLSDTWFFKSGAWSQPPGELGARSEAGGAYDAWRNRFVVFGGNLASTTPNDTWEWSGFGWSKVCTAAPCSTTLPAGRAGPAMTFDSTRKRVLMFGGSGGRSDTWTFDGAAWAEQCTTAPCSSAKPPARRNAAMAFDSARGKAVLFGGSGPWTNDTWEWDGSAWTQVCTTAPCNTSLPSARSDAGMAFDPDRGRIVLFGGRDLGALAADTWEYDGTAWTRVATTGPSARAGVQLTYDTVRKKTVLFGGGSPFDSSVRYADTWEWDGAAWTQTATAGPAVRMSHVLAYDTARRRVVAYGGTANSPLGDTWEYYTRGGACSLGTQCATGYCVDGVCCESVSCGTCEACNVAGAPGVCSAVINGSDPDSCPAATKSCDAQGLCKAKQGQSCGLPSECASGNCADTFCCDKPCAGGCDTCSATPGTCTVLAARTAGSGCGAYLCGGAAACPTTCADDADCVPTHFCDSSGFCQLRHAQSGACNLAADCKVAGACRECVDGKTCKDGFCCESGCTGTCFTCSATPGTCTSVKNAQDADTCTGASSCSSSGACLKNNGQTCGVGTECASGFCADNVCCNAACTGGCDVCNATAGTCTTLAQGSAGVSCGNYVCNGSSASCPTTCANDADCGASSYCSAAGTCQPRKAQGLACNQAAGSDCKSSGCRVCTTGNCIDGFCCDTACGGSCDACNGATLGWAGATNGTCALAPVSFAGTPACVGYACNGASAACATSCTSDAQCATGSYCNAAGACVSQKAQGSTCNLTADCKSGSCRACATGSCVDGYCCNTACNGQCQACDVGGAQGTCVTVTGAVHLNASIASRVACSGTGTCAATCNGVDSTKCNFPGASLNCGVTSCASGVQTNVGACNGGGTCNQTTSSCGNYVCGATACKTTCTADPDCASGFFCSGGTCQPKKPNGDSCSGNGACTSAFCVGFTATAPGVCCDTACTATGFSCSVSGSVGKCSKVNGQTCASATECGSGKCVDGVCCDSLCTGQCQACNVPSALGTCTNVIGAPVGARSACGGTGAGTTCGSRCDGTSATECKYPTSTLSCSSATCVSGVETTAGTCNSAGGCATTSKVCGAYLCGGTSCKSICATDADCAGGYYCKDKACTAKEANGLRCAGPTACASGNCVDGVCCNSASCGGGERCDLPSTLGKCAKGNGVACTSSTECGSGFCVDGVCCNTGCTEQCAACNLTDKVGTCSAVLGAPRGGRPACGGTGAGTDCGKVCNGVEITACAFPDGTKSCGANTCSVIGGTPIETHTGVCNSSGSCTDEPRACIGYACGGTTCKTACTANTDCRTGFYCKTGACVAIEGLGTTCTTASTCTSGFCTDGVCCAVGSCDSGKSCSAGSGASKGICTSLNGTTCTADSECVSGVCADGVCCDDPCDGSCEVCNKPGSLGKCVPIVGAPAVGHPGCTGSTAHPACGARCDGTSGKACAFPGASTTCGTPACGAGVETPVSTCNGAGACTPISKGCAPYVCGTNACLSACTKNDDCAAGNYCKAGSCVKVEGLGKDCGGNAECGSGFCTDGVCCSVGSCGEGSSCAAATSTTPGQCLKKKGVTCAKADDCASAHCVDGVCCESACNGQCEACAIAGSEGSCTPVVGAPSGARTACDDKAESDCAKAQCDGKVRDKCMGFKNGTSVACGAASCTTDKRFQKAGTCDGLGGCFYPDPKPCTPYACDATALNGCKTACAAETDCADGFRCDAGVCVQGAQCSEDRFSSTDKAGVSTSCKPYKCGTDGSCLKSCATSEDCAPGTVCDPANKACVGVAPVEDGGGCSLGSRSLGSRGLGSSGVLLGLGLALAALRRRRPQA